MSDLRERVPGHSLMDELLRQWDRGRIRVDGGKVVIDDEARGWFDGVTGERIVSRILSTLGPEWTVLHSVPVGVRGADIDHIAISQAGVFTINTKYSPQRKIWSGGRTLLVDRFKQSYVFSAMREARRAEEALTRVTGMAIDLASLVVFVTPGDLTRRSAAGDGTVDVRVISDVELIHTLTGPPVYSTEQVERIIAAAIKPETWQPRPTPWSRPEHIEREFNALEEAVTLKPRARTVPSKASAVPDRRPGRMPSYTPRRASSGRGRTRRPKRSRFERLLSEFAMPIIALVVLWSIVNSMAGR